MLHVANGYKLWKHHIIFIKKMLLVSMILKKEKFQRNGGRWENIQQVRHLFYEIFL